MNKFDIDIYTRPTCSDCQELKKYLRENEIPFHAKTVENNSMYEKELIALTGNRIVPVLVYSTHSFFKKKQKVFIGFEKNRKEISALVIN